MTISASIYDPQTECMSREQLRALQSERLRRIVRYEYENVPLYRQKMDAAGVRPEQIRGVEDICRLPFTEKSDLRDSFPYGLLAVPKQQIVRIQGSSGTTGKPIVVGYTESDVEIWTEMVARALTAAGGGADDIVQICYGYGLFTGGLGAHQGAARIGAMVVPMSSGNTQRQLMMLQELGATMLCCTPSYATLLGESLRQMNVDRSRLRLKSGCFGAEPWSEEMRQKLEELLGLEALNIYGLTEIAGPGVAYECLQKNGMHINEDHVLAEIIDPASGEPLPYGSSGELIFTTLTKQGQPMLRYRTRDICTLYDDPCPCGRNTLRMGRISGRTDDMLVIRGVNVFPSQIEAALIGVGGVAPHFVLVVERVNSSDTLEVRVELTEEMFSDTVSHLEGVKRALAEQVKSVTGVQAKITLAPPKSIPRFEGKAKRVIDNRKL
ncbi:MAG: phenylacetate--CoA ligase [Bacillota bacterium]|nr:phenylacetate--CoA ligase [Bacillota bacterium]